MLAQNFKTAADLGLNDKEFDALVKVLGMLERGELVCPRLNAFDLRPAYDPTMKNGFFMGVVRTKPECGTVACIQGWAEIVAGDDGMFFETRGGHVVISKNRPLADLFMYGDARRYDVTPAQAAIALRNYLTHGEPRWEESLTS